MHCKFNQSIEFCEEEKIDSALNNWLEIIKTCDQSSKTYKYSLSNIPYAEKLEDFQSAKKWIDIILAKEPKQP